MKNYHVYYKAMESSTEDDFISVQASSELEAVFMAGQSCFFPGAVFVQVIPV